MKRLIILALLLAPLLSAPRLEAQKATSQDVNAMVRVAIAKQPRLSAGSAIVDVSDLVRGFSRLGVHVDTAALRSVFRFPARYGSMRDVADPKNGRWLQPPGIAFVKLSAPEKKADDVIRLRIETAALRKVTVGRQEVESIETTFTFQLIDTRWVLVGSYVSAIS